VQCRPRAFRQGAAPHMVDPKDLILLPPPGSITSCNQQDVGYGGNVVHEVRNPVTIGHCLRHSVWLPFAMAVQVRELRGR
jgi:hypothetical protein